MMFASKYYWILIQQAILVLVQLSAFSVNASNLYNQSIKYENLPKNMYDQNASLLTFSTSTTDRRANTNLTAITWAHAVNSQALLDKALNSSIDMIEADIVLGKINNTGPDLPVMAHPPAKNSDISLENFLKQIMQHNSMHPDQIKGIKLDFKSIEVFEGSLDTLSEQIPLMTYPIWLNADIIRGPVNQTTTVPVDPQRFFEGSSRFDKAVLSIGWTTKWGEDFNEGNYTNEEINNMIDAIKMNNVTTKGQPITFPVRAGIAANSQEQLHELVKAVNETNESSLTIWSSQDDFVNVEKLRSLIFSFGFDRVYLDVPDDLAAKLDLERRNDGGTLHTPTLLNFCFISACMTVVSCWLTSMNIL